MRSALVALLALGAQACNGRPASTDSLAPAASASVALPPPSPFPSAPPVPSAYDLSLDVRLRTQFAQTYLGDDAQVDVEDGVFVLVAPRGSKSFEPSVALVRQALPALYNNRFSRRSSRPVSAYLFDNPASYDGFCKTRYRDKCPSPLGVYTSSIREIIAGQHNGVSTVIHELVHPIVEADFPKAPRWLREGISALFETPVISGTEIHGTEGWRSKNLHDPSQPGQPASLAALFSLPDDAFSDVGPDPLNAYAFARFACQWLDSPTQDLWKFYQRWRDNVGADPTGEKSFAEVVGQSPSEANEAWQKWLRSL
jgi:hypothetical protein